MAIYDEYREGQKRFQSKEHYSILWRNKNIYVNLRICLALHHRSFKMTLVTVTL